MSCREPISWLLLEQRALDELPAPERTRVDEHLAACETCAACFARIEKESSVPLPPLPAPAPRASSGRLLRLPWISAAGALALAAAILLYLRAQPDPERDEARVKGDAVTLSLVSSEDLAIEEAGVFHEGEAIKAVVTCPPSLNASWDLVVFDATGASFPLPAARLACGNAVPFPGAFRLTGPGSQEICVVWDESRAIDREALRREGPAATTRRACRRLSPAPR
jgi:hypothetical protein